jgi:starch-binding outer membrane protein, SusD/RagB family
MKKYTIALIIAIITSAISCDVDQNLDIPQKGVLSIPDTYYTADNEMATSFISAIYYKIHSSYYEANFLGSGQSIWNIKWHFDEMGGDIHNYWSYLQTADDRFYTQTWSYYYTIIYWCNAIIEYLPANQVATPEVKGQVIAEARTIRAIMMMYLVQLWGNPPLADHIMTGAEGNTPAADSWAFIETELAGAAEGLPSKSDPDGQSAIGGRLTKEAAYAYLGKAYLWQGKYSEAATTLYNKVIATNLYSLVTDFKELNRYTSDFCSEYMWEYDLENKGGIETSQAGLMDVTYTWGTNQTGFPDDLYDNQGWENAAYPTKSFGEFMEAHETLADGTTRSHRYRGTLASYNELLDESLFTYTRDQKGVQTTGVIGEGYFRLKLLPRVENIMGGPNWFNEFMHNNLCYMRYSEVLLNYAEAVAMGGVPGSMSGLEALNLVRRRAGLTDAPSLDMNNATYGVKAERRAELFMECSRFIDLVRWGDAPSVLADCGKVTARFYGYLNEQNQTIQPKDQWKIIYTSTTSDGFQSGKHELFPIPSVDKNNNPNLTQNPGW